MIISINTIDEPGSKMLGIPTVPLSLEARATAKQKEDNMMSNRPCSHLCDITILDQQTVLLDILSLHAYIVAEKRMLIKIV